VSDYEYDRRLVIECALHPVRLAARLKVFRSVVYRRSQEVTGQRLRHSLRVQRQRPPRRTPRRVRGPLRVGPPGRYKTHTRLRHSPVRSVRSCCSFSHMPTRQERRKAERDAAKRATKPAAAGAGGATAAARANVKREPDRRLDDANGRCLGVA